MSTSTTLVCMSDPDRWFSDEPADIAYARAECFSCPRQNTCRQEAAYYRPEFGVWGGLTPAERGTEFTPAALPFDPMTASRRDRRAEVLRLHREDPSLSLTAIGRRVGVGHQSVSKVLARWAV